MKPLGCLVALQAQSGTKKKKKSHAKKIAITCPVVLNGINDCPDWQRTSLGVWKGYQC